MRFDYVWLTWERERDCQSVDILPLCTTSSFFIVLYAVKNELLYSSEGSLELKTSNMLFSCSTEHETQCSMSASGAE